MDRTSSTPAVNHQTKSEKTAHRRLAGVRSRCAAAAPLSQSLSE